MKDLPELQGLSAEEARQRYHRAQLEARKAVEDQANTTAMTIWPAAQVPVVSLAV